MAAQGLMCSRTAVYTQRHSRSAIFQYHGAFLCKRVRIRCQRMRTLSFYIFPVCRFLGRANVPAPGILHAHMANLAAQSERLMHAPCFFAASF